MEKRETAIPGCFELRPQTTKDARGRFVKTFHSEWFAHNGMRTDWREQYYSVSRRGVLRGLHFQAPPHEHAKLVFCTSGEVMDAAVDLRIGSRTYGQHVCIVLSEAQGNAVYLDAGLAHGFYTLTESATMVYNVTSVYSPDHDAGIRWNSAGIAWPSDEPIVSDRDRGFPALHEFASPFHHSR